MTPIADNSEVEAQTEILTHAILSLVGDFPGHHGRLRTARIVGGYDGYNNEGLEDYLVETPWTLAPLVALIDGMLEDGLLATVPGPRPTLALTRAGHRALDALT